VDPVDFAVYRYLSPGGEARFWAGRRIIDPTIPAREIAARVGLSENAVRARLRSLADRGYLKGSAVTPNPALFEAQVRSVEIPIESSGESERLFRDLALVDGVVFARDTLDEGDRRVRVHFVTDQEATTARIVALLARLAAPRTPSPAAPYYVPPAEREPSPLDWRLLAARMRNPDADLGELAELVGISAKTAARRHHLLHAGRAWWWTHGPDSEEFPLALLRIYLRDSSARRAVTKRVADRAPAWMPVAPDGLGQEPDENSAIVAVLVPADAPTTLERMVKEISDLAGVERVQRTFPLGSRTYPTWFVDRVAERIPARR